jgi:probable HAF family extracellular repeat protein
MDPVNTDLGDPFIITPKTDANGCPVWNEDRNNDGINDLIIKLPLLATGMWGNALGVNSAGVVVGWSQTKGGNPHAMMWRADAQGVVTTTDLGILQGEAQSMAAAVNDSLQVAGFARTYQMRKMSLTESAFLWQNGAMKDLRSFVDQGALLADRRVGADGINNQGMIVGWAWDDVSAYPFIAVPIR